jgi:O-antigen biosynthesis protein
MFRSLVFPVELLIRTTRAIWWGLPIPSFCIDKLKGFLFGRLGLFFRGSATYRNWRFSNFPTGRSIWKNPSRGGFHLLSIEASSEPVASVIIPVRNNVGYTYACLTSIRESMARVPFEIIVVDDGSTDSTRELVPRIEGIRYVRNAQRVGLTRSRNLGASMARGRYLVFLSNATQVVPSWIDELVYTVTNVTNVGLVGSKLFFANGRLLEAGAIVSKDGSAWRCGRGDDPDKPEYNYLREVDYCSSVSILVRADLFGEAGGFDERYVSTHYEDADLAFRIRARGCRVLYQPISQVICARGPFSGTDVTTAAGSFQEASRSKFVAKWAVELNSHRDEIENPHLARELRVGKRVLMIDWHTPTPDQDAGSVITFEFTRLFQRLSYQVTFIPENILYMNRYTANLQRMGVECIYRPFTSSVKAHIKRLGKLYDVVVVFRAALGHKYLDDIRKYCTNAKIIFHTVDLYYLREERRADLEESDRLRQLARELRVKELETVRKSDCTIVVSNYEHELVTKQVPEANVTVFPLILQARGDAGSFRERRDILFLGDFRHPPNVDAVEYFVSEIWPRVRAAVPLMRLHVIGGHPPRKIIDLSGDSVVVTGHVEDLFNYLNRIRLSVAPLRYGAGIKGKIGTSLSCGLPCVASPIAIEGMGLTDGLDVLVGEDPSDFAESVLKLYTDEELWSALSANGVAFVKRNYSFDAAVERLSTILEEIRVEPRRMHGRGPRIGRVATAR